MRSWQIIATVVAGLLIAYYGLIPSIFPKHQTGKPNGEL